MFQITVIPDPADIARREVFEVTPGTLLSDWLLRQYGPDGFTLPTTLYMGSLTEGDVIDCDDFDGVNVPITGPVYIIHQPLGVDPYTAFIYAVIALVVAIAVVLLMPVPSLPGSGRSKGRSPNNALSGQTNVARPQDRVPEIFGKVRSFPDLIAPTASEFKDHIKFQIEYMCIGRGYFLLEDWKTGDTLIDSVAGSSVDEYPPGTAPAVVLKTRQSNEVSGQVLVGPNEVASVAMDSSYDASYVSGTDVATITSISSDWENFEDGDTIILTDVFANTGATDYDLSGTYTVGTVGVGVTITMTGAAAENANWTQFDAISEPLLDAGHSPVLEIPDQPAVRGPFVVAGANNFEVWLDVQAPRGLASGEKLNKSFTVDLSFLFEEVDINGDPTGPSFTYGVSITDKIRDPRFYTFKVAAGDGLTVDQRYQVTGRRITDTDPGSTERLDRVTWSRLAGIEDVAKPDDTGTTRAVVETQATQQVAALQERKFNAQATRKTVTWDGEQVVGDIDTGVGLVASRRMADSLLHYALDARLGARTVAAIDVEAMFAIQARLDAVFDGEKGEFSGTFDDPDVPALEEMRIIAQAARCFIYREGSVIAITRDEAQPVPRALFNRRNKLPNSESRAVKFNVPLDHDGVELEYRDIDDENTRTIRFPEDLPADDPHAGQPAALNPLKIEAAGIRQYTQAWDRAQYEFRRLIYRRVTVESTVSADGILVPLNARVHHVDGTRLTGLESDGEVRSVDGLQVRTTQRCVFAEDTTYSVTLRNHEGEATYPIAVTPLPGGSTFGFTLTRAPGFSLIVRGDDGAQRGTLYIFGPDGDELASAYLLQRKHPDEVGNVKLELVNYTDQYFAADSTVPPDKVPL